MTDAPTREPLGTLARPDALLFLTIDHAAASAGPCDACRYSVATRRAVVTLYLDARAARQAARQAGANEEDVLDRSYRSVARRQRDGAITPHDTRAICASCAAETLHALELPRELYMLLSVTQAARPRGTAAVRCAVFVHSVHGAGQRTQTSLLIMPSDMTLHEALQASLRAGFGPEGGTTSVPRTPRAPKEHGPWPDAAK